VQLIALDHRARPQHIAERLAEPLAPVEHAQHPPVEPQPARHQRLQELRTHRGILRRAQPQPQRRLAPLRGDAEGDNQRLPGHVDTVEEQSHQVELVQAARQLGGELPPGLGRVDD